MKMAATTRTKRAKIEITKATLSGKTVTNTTMNQISVTRITAYMTQVTITIANNYFQYRGL